MAHKLKKDAPIDLPASALEVVHFALSWDPAEPKGGGLFGLFGAKKAPGIDLDASLAVFDRHGLLIDTVWMRKTRGMEGTIHHSGDNTTGEGAGDDERITIDMQKLSTDAHYLVAMVSCFNGQTFQGVKNAKFLMRDGKSGEIIAGYAVRAEGDHTGIIMALLARDGGNWQARASGVVLKDRGIAALTDVAQAQVKAVMKY